MEKILMSAFLLFTFSLGIDAQTFNDGTEHLTKKREIKAARKAHNCKLIGDMQEAAIMYMDKEHEKAGEWLVTAMIYMFDYSGVYPMQFMYCGCPIDRKLMQDATTELVVQLKFAGAPYKHLRVIESYRDYFYGLH